MIMNNNYFFFQLFLSGYDRQIRPEIAGPPLEVEVNVAIRWSTCRLGFFSWLLDHVIYLKLRKKYWCFKLSKFSKCQNRQSRHLSENSCIMWVAHAQLDINHVVQHKTFTENWDSKVPSVRTLLAYLETTT